LEGDIRSWGLEEAVYGQWEGRMHSFEESKARVMTIKDVAYYLKVSVSKVYRMANANELPAFRVGKSWRFKQDMIDSWIQQECSLLRED
jgi:excisionase family DNA binding protein